MLDPKTNEDLKCYASGNGALSFCWIRNGNGSGRHVTVADAKAYLASDEAKSLRESGDRVCCVDGKNPILVAPVKRVSPDILELNGKRYSYVINRGDLFFQRDNHVREVSLYLKSVEHGIDVKNLNTIMACVFFLNNERTLVEQKAGL